MSILHRIQSKDETLIDQAAPAQYPFSISLQSLVIFCLIRFGASPASCKLKEVMISRLLLLLLAATWLACLLSSLGSAVAITHHVGGERGWSLSSDLQTWGDDNKFYVGDSLVFEYTPEYDVREVSQLAYMTCNPTEPLAVYEGGLSRILLTEAGTRFFVDGRQEYCKMGLMLQVNVLPQP